MALDTHSSHPKSPICRMAKSGSEHFIALHTDTAVMNLTYNDVKDDLLSIPKVSVRSLNGH